jgi:hypothetical protein
MVMGCSAQKKNSALSAGENDSYAHTTATHRAAPLNNVANVKVLPVANTNTQLEIGTGNWQH